MQQCGLGKANDNFWKDRNLIKLERKSYPLPESFRKFERSLIRRASALRNSLLICLFELVCEILLRNQKSFQMRTTLPRTFCLEVEESWLDNFEKLILNKRSEIFFTIFVCNYYPYAVLVLCWGWKSWEEIKSSLWVVWLVGKIKTWKILNKIWGENKTYFPSYFLHACGQKA